MDLAHRHSDVEDPGASAPGSSRAPVLAAREVSVRFDGVLALDRVDLELRDGEILGLIGPNGAGKTTLVNVLSGFQRPSAGRVLLHGADVTGIAPHRRVRRGMARTFQSARLFAELSVVGNVEPAALAAGMDRRAAREAALVALEVVGLRAHHATRAGDLPHGDERLVGVARALATQAPVLLLDEPAAGLNDVETARLADVLLRVRGERSCSLVLIEHDFKLIMAVSDRLHVLDHGRTLAVGDPAVVRADAAVIDAYLGVRHGAPAAGSAPC